MSDFKVGNEVWFLGIIFEEYDFKIDGDYHSFDPSRLILKSDIIDEVYEEDKVYLLDENPGIYFNEAYRSKEDCIDAYINRLFRILHNHG